MQKKLFFAVLVGIVNSYSAKLAAQVQVLTTVMKVAALVIILVGGIVMLFEGIYCVSVHPEIEQFKLHFSASLITTKNNHCLHLSGLF